MVRVYTVSDGLTRVLAREYLDETERTNRSYAICADHNISVDF